MFEDSSLIKISIVITTYNRRVFLQRALNSVLSQAGVFEIIVVDDASSDDTQSFIKKYVEENNVFYIRKKSNQGVNSSRNLSLDIVKGDWVAFLDDDDEFLPNTLSLMKSKISEMPGNYNVAYFNTLINNGKQEFDGGFQFKNIKNNSEFYDPTYEETFKKFNLRGDCKPVFRKDLFNEKKYFFPESVNGFESYMMNLIARDNKGIRYFNNKVTYIHQEPNLSDRLSINAPRKNPWPLLVLHSKQIFQHFPIYVKNPLLFLRKIVEMSKLLLRSVFIFSQKYSSQK